MGLGAAIKVVEHEAQATPLAQVVAVPSSQPVKITVAAAEELLNPPKAITIRPLDGCRIQGWTEEQIREMLVKDGMPATVPEMVNTLARRNRQVLALQGTCTHAISWPGSQLFGTDFFRDSDVPQVVAMVNVSGACNSNCQICGHIRDYPKGLVPLLRSGKFTEETGGDAYDSALHLAFASGWIGESVSYDNPAPKRAPYVRRDDNWTRPTLFRPGSK